LIYFSSKHVSKKSTGGQRKANNLAFQYFLTETQQHLKKI